jgi:hypothetical protein
MSNSRADRRGADRRRSRIAVGMPLALIVTVVTLFAAGCGGGDSDRQANEAYANNVCTAIGSWEQQVKSIATSFSGDISKASLQEKVTQVEAATTTLVSEIKAVPPPDSSEGQAAKQQLDQLSSDITNTVNAAKSAVTQIQDDASVASIAAAIAALAPQVKTLADETKSAVSTLKSAGGSLASAFKSTDSCQNLG